MNNVAYIRFIGGIFIAAGTLVGLAIFIISIPFALVALGGWAGHQSSPPGLSLYIFAILIISVPLLISAVLICTGVRLLRLRRWSRISAVVLGIMTICFSLSAFLDFPTPIKEFWDLTPLGWFIPPLIPLLLAIILIAFLLSERTREIFLQNGNPEFLSRSVSMAQPPVTRTKPPVGIFVIAVGDLFAAVLFGWSVSVAKVDFEDKFYGGVYSRFPDWNTLALAILLTATLPVITWALFALKAWVPIAQKIAGPLMVIAWWVQVSEFGLWSGPILPGLHQSDLDAILRSVLLGFATWSFWYLSRQPIKALFQTPRA